MKKLRAFVLCLAPGLGIGCATQLEVVRLNHPISADDVIVYQLPRTQVVVNFEFAKESRCPGPLAALVRPSQPATPGGVSQKEANEFKDAHPGIRDLYPLAESLNWRVEGAGIRVGYEPDPAARFSISFPENDPGEQPDISVEFDPFGVLVSGDAVGRQPTHDPLDATGCSIDVARSRPATPKRAQDQASRIDDLKDRRLLLISGHRPGDPSADALKVMLGQLDREMEVAESAFLRVSRTEQTHVRDATDWLGEQEAAPGFSGKWGSLPLVAIGPKGELCLESSAECWKTSVEQYQLELELSEMPVVPKALSCRSAAPCSTLVHRIARNGKLRLVRTNGDDEARVVLDEKDVAITQLGALAKLPAQFADAESLATVRLHETSGAIRALGATDP